MAVVVPLHCPTLLVACFLNIFVAHTTSILPQVLLYNHKYKDKPTICTLLSICWSLWSTINCRVCCSFSPNSNNNKNMYAYPVPLNVQQINLLQMTQKEKNQIKIKITKIGKNFMNIVQIFIACIVAYKACIYCTSRWRLHASVS